MKYRLVAIDLDGTLLNSKKQIGELSLAAIRTARDRRVRIVISTARPLYRIARYLDLLGLTGPEELVICFNGAQVISCDGTRVRYDHPFAEADLRELTAVGRSVGFPMFAYRGDGILASADDPVYRERNPDAAFEVREDYDGVDWASERIYKFALVGRPDAVLTLRRGLDPALTRKYEVSSSVPQFVDIVSRGVSKASALARIGELWGIGPEAMIAFGDEDNDIPMLQFVGMPVAMVNASPEVKAVANMVAPSNDQDGVGRILEDLLGSPS